MIPQLKPDIYRCIGKHLAPTTTSARLDNEAHEDTKAYQQNLLNLMKSSRTLYEIFAPQLYNKCSVGNLSSIFTSLNNGNSMLYHIQHLHLYSGKHNGEPTYFDLIRGDMWRGLNRHGVEEGPWSGTDEIMKCALVANLLHNSLLHDRISPFPKLRSISLGGPQDHMWGSPLAEGWEKRVLKDPGVTTVYKVLPVTLLAIPSVEHFCTSVEEDPLRNTVIELYDFCPADIGLTLIEEAQTEADRTYITREEMQVILEIRLPEIWKGKVSMKSKADAPPCTACGRKLMDN